MAQLAARPAGNYANLRPVGNISDPILFRREGISMNRAWMSAKGVLVAAAIVSFAGVASAADDKKDDPSGKWKWSVTTKDGQTRETTLTLKLDGGKLTGTITGRNNQQTAIEEGAFKDGEVSFNVTRERNGQKFTTKYKGKVSGDTITGTVERREGQSRDWKAERVK
jgi:hypothetical protein